MKRTPEQVCIEYAIAAQLVRSQNRILRDSKCEIAARASKATYASGFDGFPYVVDPPQEAEPTCLDDHFEIEVYQGGNDCPMERPKLPFDEMCDACKKRWYAIQDRRRYRHRLGAAKRSIEAMGKRLNAAVNNG